MHVELRGDVGIQNGVDVFEMGASGVLVQLVGLGVGSMEVTASAGEHQGGVRGETTPGPHH